MPLLNEHPHHIRKSIALVVTIGFAVILIIVLISVYTMRRKPAGEKSSVLRDFYTTIVERGQSTPEAK